MKTAAAIVVVLALISIFHKEKKHEPPPPVFRPPIVQQAGQNPENETPTTISGQNQQGGETGTTAPVVDTVKKNQVFTFAKALCRGKITDQTLNQIAESIVMYSDNYDLDYALMAALIGRESRFNPNAVSRSGAKGLGQLIDSTARNMGINDPFDIDQNINGTLKYYKILFDTWANHSDQNDRALASYLLGPRVVQNCDCVPVTSQPYLKDIYAYRDQILAM
jgi:membrane-bound lytic murein transglycosylase MltF